MTSKYKIGDIIVTQREYLLLFDEGEEYEIVDIENNLGDLMYYVSHNGKRIASWGLKEFELDIQFIKKPTEEITNESKFKLAI